MAEIADRWSAGSAYEEFMGRWSRELSPKFVSWLEVASDAHWLDVGCGTGALTEAIGRLAKPASVVGCDPAEPFVDYAKAHIANDRTSFVVAGAGSLPGRPNGFDSVTSCLALNFFPDPSASVAEMREVATDGGLVSSSVWDYSDGMQFLRIFWDAAARIDAKAAKLHEGERFPLCRSDALIELFRSAGLREVRCEAIEIATDFSSFDEFWGSFQGGSGPAPSYVASLEDESRAALAKELAHQLPGKPGEPVQLTARAWAVRGIAG